MLKLGLITRIHVLTAVKVHDQQGAAEFLAGLGFDPLDSGPRDELLVERGKRYLAPALLAYAYGRATGTPLTAEQVPFGATDVLRELGFRLAAREELDRPAQPKRTRAPATRTPRSSAPKKPKTAPKPERELKLCPTCYTALPVSGRCDYCD